MKYGGILVAGLVCSGAAMAGEQQEALEQAQQLWQAQSSASYEYAYFKECDCYRDGPPLTVVTVANGEIDQVAFVRQDSGREIAARDDALDSYWTIDDLFARIAGALERQAELSVEYHETLGYPLNLYIDYDADFIGDETDLRLTRLEFR